MTLARARCINHESRMASGICQACRRPCCRECLTEHDGRLTCASCLRRTEAPTRSRGSLKSLTIPAMLIAALLASWLFFYILGSSLELMTVPQ